MNEYLNPFVATRNTRSLASVDELALVIPRCKTDQLSRSFLAAVGYLWNLLPSGVLGGGILRAFKSSMNLCLLRA